MKEVNKVLYLGPAAHYQKAKYTEADSKVMMGTTMGAASLTSHGGLGSIKILGVKKGHNKAGVEMAVVNFQLYGKDGKAAGSASAITVVKTKEGWKVDIMAT
jgi:hypothetical protein